MTLVDAALSGDRLALSRLLTQVENDLPEGRLALKDLFPHCGRAHMIGVTGAPGTGKSSLVNQLALCYRRRSGKRVAIVAVDPTSPFSGGAVLGDRVRMRDLSGDPQVFIRSMASRGSLGGLAQTTAAVAQVFDAAGYEIILIETVGAGQSEVDIARLAHTTMVVETPGLGDDIQTIKAGILEIADILVLNKADLKDADGAERALRGMLEMGHAAQRPRDAQETWTPPILRTVALDGSGVEQVMEAIARHADYLRRTGEWERRERARLTSEVEMLMQAALAEKFRASVRQDFFDNTLSRVFDHQLSPWEAVRILLNGRGK